MNPARRKLFHILSKNKDAEFVPEGDKKVDTKLGLVDLPKVELPVIEEEIKVELPQILADEPKVEEVQESEETKPTALKNKKSKKDVEVG